MNEVQEYPQDVEVNLFNVSDNPSEEWQITPSLIHQVEEKIDEDDWQALQPIVDSYHYSAQADLIQGLKTKEQRIALAQFLAANNQYDFWPELDEAIRSELTDSLDVKDLSNVVKELEIDDAVALLEDVDDDREREAIIQNLDKEDQQALRESFSWPEDSAGRLMDQSFVTLPSYLSVGDAIDWFRLVSEKEENSLPEDFFNVYLLDPRHKPVGQVSLSTLLCTKRNVDLRDIKNDDITLIDAETDQEEVAFLFKQKDLVAAPVVDKEGRMIGEITVDDVLDVIEEEYEEDFMALGGVHEEDLYEKVFATAKARIRWLFLNMGTAIFAAFVVQLFDATIQSIVILAALMPIVASMGGNAGSQTLTVAVRALATRELGPASAWRFIRKEFAVGLTNGILLALLGAVLTYLWQHNIGLSFVIGLAIILNMLVAALCGALVPLGLSKIGVDPAIASSVFLTAFTDVVGFFVFLGFATIFLL